MWRRAAPCRDGGSEKKLTLRLQPVLVGLRRGPGSSALSPHQVFQSEQWERSDGVNIHFSNIVSWSATLFFFLSILLLIETQIAAEETVRRLISVLCNEAGGRRRPTGPRLRAGADT